MDLIAMSDNSYWFLGLGFISVVLLIYVCIKQNTVRSLLLFLMMVEIAYLIETIIFIFLGSYEYHPELIKHSAYYDSILGALSSNLFIVPVLATLIATFRLRWWWIVIFSGLLGGMEWLFIKLQIYTHFWWRIEYTIVGLPAYFWIAKVLYNRILQPAKGWLHSLFLYLCTAPLLGTLHIIPIMLLMNRYYHTGWFKDSAHDTTAFSSLYYLCGTIVIIIAVKLRLKRRLKRRWLTFMLLTAFFYSVTIVLKGIGILDSRTWWDPLYYALIPPVVYLISEALSKRLSNGPPAKAK